MIVPSLCLRQYHYQCTLNIVTIVTVEDKYRKPSGSVLVAVSVRSLKTEALAVHYGITSLPAHYTIVRFQCVQRDVIECLFTLSTALCAPC